jgi:hypothetical protein
MNGGKTLGGLICNLNLCVKEEMRKKNQKDLME